MSDIFHTGLPTATFANAPALAASVPPRCSSHCGTAADVNMALATANQASELVTATPCAAASTPLSDIAPGPQPLLVAAGGPGMLLIYCSAR